MKCAEGNRTVKPQERILLNGIRLYKKRCVENKMA